MPDHVHLFVRVGTTDAPAAVVRAFKGRTARVLRAEFSYLRRLAKVLCSPAYFAASVGYVSESTVRRYIEYHGTIGEYQQGCRTSEKTDARVDRKRIPAKTFCSRSPRKCARIARVVVSGSNLKAGGRGL